MPNPQKLSKVQLSLLSKLPRISDLVIEGGKRRLGLYFRKDKETYQPQVVLWLEAEHGFIRASNLVMPDQTKDEGISEALVSLLASFTGPFSKLPGALPLSPPSGAPVKSNGAGSLTQQAGLPAKVRINDAKLAEAARTLLAPLNIPVEFVADLPTFEEAFEALSSGMGADEDAGPPEPFSWEIDQALLPPLYKATAAYWRRAPWKYMLDDPPVMLKLGENGPQPGVDTLYASIMGGGQMFTGIAFYYSLEAFERTLERGGEMVDEDDERIDEAINMLQQAGAPIEGVPPEQLRHMVAGLIEQEEGEDEEREELLEEMEDCLAVYLEHVEEVDPTYLEWLEEHGLKYPSRQGIPSFQRMVQGAEPREPNAQEVKTLTLAIEALNQFFSKYHEVLDGPFLPLEEIVYNARIGDTKTKGSPVAQVELLFPPPDYEWDDDGDYEEE